MSKKPVRSKARPIVKAFFDAGTNTVSYVVHDADSKAAAIIDPVLDFTAADAHISTAGADAILSHIAENGLSTKWILETHAHADHLSAADYLKKRTGSPTAIGAHITKVQKVFVPIFGEREVNANGTAFDRLLHDGDELPLGGLTIRAMHTPGHTPACMTYIIGDAAFVGDTLFMPDYGTARADFPGGDAATLYHSIRHILSLPAKTRIFVGHDYLPAGRTEFAWETSVAEEKKSNVHVHDGVDEASFVTMRRKRDATLAAPALILPSLQVNIRGGKLPEPGANGHRYLKLPINTL